MKAAIYSSSHPTYGPRRRTSLESRMAWNISTAYSSRPLAPRAPLSPLISIRSLPSPIIPDTQVADFCKEFVVRYYTTHSTPLGKHPVLEYIERTSTEIARNIGFGIALIDDCSEDRMGRLLNLHKPAVKRLLKWIASTWGIKCSFRIMHVHVWFARGRRTGI
jgi:hypothetical protein